MGRGDGEHARDCDANAALVAWRVGPLEAKRVDGTAARGVELGEVALEDIHPLLRQACQHVESRTSSVSFFWRTLGPSTRQKCRSTTEAIAPSNCRNLWLLQAPPARDEGHHSSSLKEYSADPPSLGHGMAA